MPTRTGTSRQLQQRIYPALMLFLLAIEIEASGDPSLWNEAPLGKLDRRLARCVGEALLRQARLPKAQRSREAMRKFLRRLERGSCRRSTYGRDPEFTRQLAASVMAFADWLRPPQRRGPRNSPKGKARTVARRVVDRELAEFTKWADSEGHPEWGAWLREAGSGRQLSSGRAALADHVRARARMEGYDVGREEILAAIRDSLKAERRAR